MSTTAVPPMTAAPIRLRFEMTFAEQLEIAQEARTSRYPLLLTATGALMIALAAFNVGMKLGSDSGGGDWSVWFGAVVHMFLGWNLLTNNSVVNWLTRLFSRGVSRSDLELDANGIRGTFEVPTPYRKGPEVKRIAYGWRKVRRIHRAGDDFVLEFHGGGMVTLPARVFGSRDERRQCLDWAEQGLAEQRQRVRAA